MISDLDKNKSGSIDFEEFLDGITAKLGDKESRVHLKLIQSGINKIFDLFDDDRTGKININNIRRVAKELGETMNVSELEEMLQRAATNGREITKEDFYNIMTKKTF